MLYELYLNLLLKKIGSSYSSSKINPMEAFIQVYIFTHIRCSLMHSFSKEIPESVENCGS